MAVLVIIVLAALCVAYANGANDNFKGVATLFGSGTTNYRRALLWATGATFLGSLTALFLAGNLIKSFGGKGLVEDSVAIQPVFAAAVGLGAGLTVLIASRIGMPISTTHSLLGGLIGTGLVAGSALNTSILGTKFLLPLVASPILAILAAAVIYPVLRFARIRLGVERDFCVCVGESNTESFTTPNQALAIAKTQELSIGTGTQVECQSRYHGKVLGIPAGKTLDTLHFLSAGMLSFARGLNDTPKIAALLLLVPFVGTTGGLLLIGAAIAVGGWLSARQVAETVSKKITPMNHGQGFTANLLSALIVIGASRFGVPVSTTHVSCGALFGIGAATGQARKAMIGRILVAWLVTLPLAATIASTCYFVLNAMG